MLLCIFVWCQGVFDFIKQQLAEISNWSVNKQVKLVFPFPSTLYRKSGVKSLIKWLCGVDFWKKKTNCWSQLEVFGSETSCTPKCSEHNLLIFSCRFVQNGDAKSVAVVQITQVFDSNAWRNDIWSEWKLQPRKWRGKSNGKRLRLSDCENEVQSYFQHLLVNNLQ